MTNLIVKENGTQVFNIEISNVFLSGEELTLSLKANQYVGIPLLQGKLYFITIDNDLGNGIIEKPAIYRSYLFSITDDKVQQQNEQGEMIEVPTNQISANQLLFEYI